MLTHVGLIMDGNGRWAQARGMRRCEGYKYGLDALLKVCSRFAERGVKVVSAYAFSTENIARPDEEKRAIFDVVRRFNNDYDGDMRVTYMGDIDSLPEDVAESVDFVEARTAQNRGLQLNIAMAYGSRDDIALAAKRAADSGEFTEDAFKRNLSTSGLPDLDLIVRSGGQKRLSNFMLYEAAYAEIIFSDKLWCDMDETDADAFYDEFNSRIRKFGR